MVFGPLCMNIDALASPIALPPLTVGQSLVIACVGAYNNTQWMQFSQLRPAVVMVAADGSVELLRRAESLQDVKAPERLPTRYAPPAEPGNPTESFRGQTLRCSAVGAAADRNPPPHPPVRSVHGVRVVNRSPVGKS